MAFQLHLMRLKHACAAYQRHVRVRGMPALPVAADQCQRSTGGTWTLRAANQEMVAQVRADGVVTIAEP
jgi:hypothetical protein